MAKKVIVVGGGSPIDPDILKKLHEAGASDVVAVDSLSELEDREVPEKIEVPTMEDIMVDVKTREAARKKRLRQMGRAQFKKKNRRKI